MFSFLLRRLLRMCARRGTVSVRAAPSSLDSSRAPVAPQVRRLCVLGAESRTEVRFVDCVDRFLHARADRRRGPGGPGAFSSSSSSLLSSSPRQEQPERRRLGRGLAPPQPGPRRGVMMIDPQSPRPTSKPQGRWARGAIVPAGFFGRYVFVLITVFSSPRRGHLGPEREDPHKRHQRSKVAI